ncbi:unnamed protein product [Rotaria sp. Silwood2]|nr:unnamed protein product [Rotaria sp. Silwood2]CAF3231999.1 unnamed protein product [Rotaria sp. Silwood2]CAF4200523.1 unnamed protein product [Rotaria sp. Silwood2]CAF4324770.1 unnamed protein product [Rotaria sp. Silwood2]
MCTPVEFATTTKGHPLMMLDGYLYTIHTCNSTITKTHVMTLKQNGTHSTSCNRDIIKITPRKFREDVTNHVKNIQETTDTVLSQMLLKNFLRF